MEQNTSHYFILWNTVKGNTKWVHRWKPLECSVEAENGAGRRKSPLNNDFPGSPFKTWAKPWVTLTRTSGKAKFAVSKTKNLFRDLWEAFPSQRRKAKRIQMGWSGDGWGAFYWDKEQGPGHKPQESMKDFRKTTFMCVLLQAVSMWHYSRIPGWLSDNVTQAQS